MTSSSDTPEFFWDPLLEQISNGRVIPIVGQDLVTVRHGTETTPLYALLAARLAAKLEVKGSPAELSSLNAVAGRYLEVGDRLEKRDKIYTVLKSVMPPDSELAVPESLLKLAGIESFKLFVTTTFDNLLQRAIDQVRFQGAPTTQVFAYCPERKVDLPMEVAALKRPGVFHLMGQLSASPEYVVTEEDTVEFVHALRSKERQPDLLVDELARHHVLLIGSGFSDWLARFFIRLLKHERLWMAPGKTFIADGKMLGDTALRAFLRHFSSGTRVFETGGAHEFVDELYKRSEPGTREVESPNPVPPDAVFLSYAHEDRRIVENIERALKKADVPVWFDREEIQDADPFEPEIRRGIGRCALFAPIISKNVIKLMKQGERRFLFKEWKFANDVADEIPPGRRFFIPVAIDETTPKQVEQDVGTGGELPRWFKVDWAHLPEGEVTDEFVKRVRQLYRDYVLRRAQS